MSDETRNPELGSSGRCGGQGYAEVQTRSAQGDHPERVENRSTESEVEGSFCIACMLSACLPGFIPGVSHDNKPGMVSRLQKQILKNCQQTTRKKSNERFGQ